MTGVQKYQNDNEEGTYGLKKFEHMKDIFVAPHRLIIPILSSNNKKIAKLGLNHV
jgi:hypothetical protein